MRRYQENLDRRKQIFEAYDSAFSEFEWAILPLHTTENKISSYHLYQLRIANVTEQQRDAIMQGVFDQDVSVNVHFLPLPTLTAYKKRGYKMEDYPETWNKYHNEISLPVYFDLNDEMVKRVIEALTISVNTILG